MNKISQALPQGKIWKVIGLLLSLLVFFVSLELLGDAFGLLGEGVAEGLLAATSNPITGLFTGILATTLLQSSSTTTSLTVALVASGNIGTTAAIPVMLGANIGTSVTNTIVALGHVNNQEEFQRAFTGSLVLDFFNIIAVLIFLPLELTTQILSWSATQLTNLLTGVGVIDLFSPLDLVVEPIAEFIVNLTQETGWIVLIIAFASLYFALRSLVKVLRSLLDDDLQGKIKKYLFKTPWQAMLFGLALTIAVQSSSITTSVLVPIIALGVVVAMQALPYFLGANIGTSTTALIAAMSLASDGSAEGIASLNVALVHMVFDIYAILLLFPLTQTRKVPVWLAERTGGWLSKGRILSIVYIALVFYLLPFAGVWATKDLEIGEFYEPVVPQEVEQLQAEDVEGASEDSIAGDDLLESDLNNQTNTEQ